MHGELTVNNAQAHQAVCIAGLGQIQVPAMVPPHGLAEVLPASAVEMRTPVHAYGFKFASLWKMRILGTGQ